MDFCVSHTQYKRVKKNTTCTKYIMKEIFSVNSGTRVAKKCPVVKQKNKSVDDGPAIVDQI